MNQLVTDPNLVRARAAAPAWAATPIAERLAILRQARFLLVRDAPAIAATVKRPEADTLAAELMPLIAALRWLERRAGRLLAPRRLRSPAPGWLFGIRQEIRREPRGVVLVLAPANYPLFLPGAQTVQALAAGNAVCVKPPPGRAEPIWALADRLAEAGLPPGVLQILPEDAGPAAVRAGFDHIVLTGGVETGLAVARAAAETLTPSTMELSGVDPVFVLPGADLALVAACLAYGLRLNTGATCIAPRRVYVPRALEADLLSRVLGVLPPPAALPPPLTTQLARLLDAAERDGARIAARNPAVIAGVRAALPAIQEDVFAPWIALVPVADTEEALAAAALCPYALGASIFGPPSDARALAARVQAGSVCINDVIAPTADPRLPFGGRARSGYGVTRGAEGLLEMTVVKTISTRALGFRPHLDPRLSDPARLLILLRLLYGTWTDRKQTLRALALNPRSPTGRG